MDSLAKMVQYIRELAHATEYAGCNMQTLSNTFFDEPISDVGSEIFFSPTAPYFSSSFFPPDSTP